MKKNVLSIVLALVLCLSLLPVTAFAEEPETYGLWIGGVEVNSENADDVLDDGTVSYEHTTRTLTLNGAEITGGTINKAKDTVGIYSIDQLAIVLVGENSIKVPDGDSSAGICVAMTWTVNTGIIGGYNDNTLGPQNTATRAQVAKMLMKFIVG